MKLSIITVTMNNAANLKRTLASVASQTYKEFEQIVVDGNSKDESVSIIKSFEGCIANYHWVSEPDMGIYDAMNKGIRMANGEYCLFLNAGDVLANDSVLDELEANNPTADIVSCNAILEKSKYHQEWYSISPKEIKASDLILSNLPHQATLIRRELFETIHEYDTSFRVISDWLFFIEAILKYDASYQHVNMFLARCETEGISNNPANNAMMDEEFHLGLKKVLPLYYEDYSKLRAERMNGKTDRDKFMGKLAASWFGSLLWKFRNGFKRLGYYHYKHNCSRHRFYRQLLKEDKALKREIAAKIEILPEHVLNRQNNDYDVIVSLTSYGKRVSDTAPYAIYSIFTQSVLPNRVVLWLDKAHWNDDNLPRLLKRLKQSGLEVCYCDDIRSYKKLIPSLKKFPNNPIVVIDDDFYYHKDFVKWMVETYERSDKRTVFATWGCVPEKINGTYLPYSQWKDSRYGNNKSEFSLYGAGGAIYPPHIFDEEIFRQDIFMNLCPTADDLWFWVQEKRRGVNVRMTPQNGYGLHTPVNRIEEYDQTQKGTLFYQNCIQGKNDEQLNAVLKHYDM